MASDRTRVGVALVVSLLVHATLALVLGPRVVSVAQPRTTPAVVFPIGLVARPGGGGPPGGAPGEPGPTQTASITPAPPETASAPVPPDAAPVLPPMPATPAPVAKAPPKPRPAPARPVAVAKRTVPDAAAPAPVVPSAPAGDATGGDAVASRASGGGGSGGGAGGGDGGGGGGDGGARPAYATNPKPPYPVVARRLGMEGVVTLEVLVRPDGTPGDVRIRQSSGHEILDDSALATVRDRWRFVPARRGGTQVEDRVVFPIRFRLSQG